MDNDDMKTGESLCSQCGRSVPEKTLYWVCRQIERAIYDDDVENVEIEVAESDVLAEFCSLECMEAHRVQWLSGEAVQLTMPGVSLGEICSKCGDPVNMAQFHVAWVEDVGKVVSGSLVPEVEPECSTVLAIACNKCEPVSVR